MSWRTAVSLTFDDSSLLTWCDLVCKSDRFVDVDVDDVDVDVDVDVVVVH